jgi:hypothetical protein
MFIVSGVSGIQGCVHRLLSGGMEMLGLWSDEFVQRNDVGEFQQPGFSE